MQSKGKAFLVEADQGKLFKINPEGEDYNVHSEEKGEFCGLRPGVNYYKIEMYSVVEV